MAVIYFPERIICTRHRNVYSVCRVKKKKGVVVSTIVSKMQYAYSVDGQSLQQNLNVEMQPSLGYSMPSESLLTMLKTRIGEPGFSQEPLPSSHICMSQSLHQGAGSRQFTNSNVSSST